MNLAAPFIRITRAQLDQTACYHKPGYIAAVLDASRLDGDFIEYPLEAWRQHKLEYLLSRNINPGSVDEPDRPSGAPAEPTLAELAGNFTGAMTRWAAAGFATVSAETYAARAAVCDTCEHWDGSARFGLGKCGAPGCGCTSFKRWLATEKCPLSRWSAQSSE